MIHHIYTACHRMLRFPIAYVSARTRKLTRHDDLCTVTIPKKFFAAVFCAVRNNDSDRAFDQSGEFRFRVSKRSIRKSGEFSHSYIHVF